MNTFDKFISEWKRKVDAGKSLPASKLGGFSEHEPNNLLSSVCEMCGALPERCECSGVGMRI